MDSNTPKTKVIDGKEYVTGPEGSTILKIKVDTLRSMYFNGKLRGLQQKVGSRVIVYLLIDDILIFKQKMDEMSVNYYSQSEVINKTKLTAGTIKKYRLQGIFPNIANCLGANYILKDDVEQYLLKKRDFEKKYYTIEQAGKKLRMKVSKLRYLYLKHKKFDVVIFHGINYIPKKQIDAYLKITNFINNDEFISIPDAVKIYGLSRNFISFNSQKLPSTIRVHWRLTMVNKRELESIIEQKKIQKEYYDEHIIINEVEVAYQYFLEIVNERYKNCSYSETITLFNSFVVGELEASKSSNLKKDVYRYTSFSNTLQLLHKEIYKYSDLEIQLLVKNKNVSNSQGLVLIEFLKYCKSKRECKFKKIPKRGYRQDASKSQEIYAETVFMKFGLYISDVESNTAKAIKNPRYCQLWIYVLFHMFEAWRANDILKISNIILEQIGIFGLDYFSSNKLDITQAQVIINQYYMHELVVNKTGALNCLNVPEILIEALGTALVIAEIHRRKNNKDNLMYAFRGRNPDKQQLLSFFGGNQELAAFSNLKACRTLMTLFFEWVEKQPECHKEAHEMVHRLRMHKTKKIKTLNVAQTDTVYIQNLNDESKIETFSKAMFDRGIFGWLYYLILKTYMNKSDFKQLEFNDVTKLIVSMQEKQSHIQMEGLIKFLLQQQDKKKLLIEEIRSMPQQKLWEKLKNLHIGVMPSRIPEAQCFKYGNCPHPRPHEQVCRQCQYLIPNKYFLVSLANGLNKTADKLIDLYKEEVSKGIDLRADIAKKRSILIDYIYLLGEARNEEYGLGDEIVRAFINIKDFQEKAIIIKELQKKRQPFGGVL